MIKTIPQKNKCRKAKWLSEEALQIAEKRKDAKGNGEKERYAHLCMKWSLGISYSLEISNLSHSIIFLYLFALATEKGFHISPCYSLELCIQMGVSFPLASLFSFICKTSSDNHFAFLHSFFFGMILVTTSYTMLRVHSSVHSSSSTLSIRSNALNLFVSSTV